MNPDTNQSPSNQTMSPAPSEDPNLQEIRNINPLHVQSPGERVICTIKRHPIGLFGVYFMSGLLFVLLIVGVAALPRLATDLSSTDKTYAFALALLFAMMILVFVYIAAIIYKGNRWIVTSDSITQIAQTGLFHKEASQLSLGNLEDVTFTQDTFIQTIFGYGTLKVETAGEHSKFQFPFCPAPQKCAVEIIQAHEDFVTQHGGKH